MATVPRYAWRVEWALPDLPWGTHSVKEFRVWNTVSMAWTEIGLGNSEYPAIAEKLRADYATWDEVNDIIQGDVLGSFAILSLLLPLAMVPVIGLFLITPFPDSGYEEASLKRRIARWQRYPRWAHYLNPLRLAGYPLASLLSFSVRYKLKRAFHRAKPR